MKKEGVLRIIDNLDTDYTPKKYGKALMLAEDFLSTTKNHP